MRTRPERPTRPPRQPLRPWRVLGSALLLPLLISPSGCSPCSSDASPPEVRAAAAPERRERSLPYFEGRLLDGGTASTERLQHRRGLVYVFSASDPDAGAVAAILKSLEKEAAAANIGFLGIANEPDLEEARAFVRRNRLGFPILHDPRGSIRRRLGIPVGRTGLLVVDSGGYVVGGFAGLDGDPEAQGRLYEGELRRLLRLERGEDALAQIFGLQPPAPDFTVQTPEGKPLRKADLKGRVVVLVFFSPTCPHCHQALRFLDRLAQKLESEALSVVPISVSNRRYVIEDMVEKLGIRLATYLDPKRTAQEAYGNSPIVPDLIVIDREGRLVGRHTGADPRIEAIVTMEVRGALGIENPILLDREGYSGEEACRVCHRPEHQTWALTNHAYAFETLVRHGSDRDPECLPCHTVGWEKPGGYSRATPAPHLEGVQCENCHGRGGPHQSPGFTAKGYEPICLGCHNPQHSLGFMFAERLPEVSHGANRHFASLSIEERQALLERRSHRKRKLFPDGDYVGSKACRGCHEAEYAIWEQSPHAHAFATLERENAADRSDCQRCHTTGFDRPGGFPAGGENLRSVGCESCHGPGASHAAEGARRSGTILALADKCDSCVILQICGTCHDEKNDPGFEFEVIEKIDRIRHGPASRASATR
ncbi:MAG: multiheme c-type cytochrome [Myxococcota bacterium]